MSLRTWKEKIDELLARYRRGETDDLERIALIRAQNDYFRATGTGGVFLMTTGVDALPPDIKATVLRRTLTFFDFTAENDPHKEHDCFSFEAGGKTFIAKIDYYDKSMTYGSEDPADPEQTTRVLTVMLAEDY